MTAEAHGSGPLAGKAVVITRAREQAADLAERLDDLGAEVLEFPTIRIVDPEDWAPLDGAIADLVNYDWVVFSSANAVDAFVRRLEDACLSWDTMAGVRVAAVGTATAARCEQAGIRADFVPEDHQAEGLIAGFKALGVGEGTRVLVPRAMEARELLPDTLREWGATVDVVPAYRTVRGQGDATVIRRLAEGTVDAITFTSSSTVKHFVALAQGLDLDDAFRDVAVASIGPVTSRTAREAGLRVDVEAKPSTIPSLVGAIERHFGE